MTRKITDDQQLVLDELLRALDASGSTAPLPGAILDVLAFSTQARRLRAHFGPNPWPALEVATDRAEIWLKAHPADAAAALDGLVPTDALDVLESALCEVPGDHPEEDAAQAAPILDALFDLDHTLSALECLGRRTDALLEEAVDLVRSYSEGAAVGSAQARRFIARHGTSGGAAPVYAEVSVAAERQIERTVASPATGLPAWLTTDLETRAEPNVLRLPMWVRRQRPQPEAFEAAAADEHAPIPEWALLWSAEDASWELGFESAPDGSVSLVMYTHGTPPVWGVVGPDGVKRLPESTDQRAAITLDLGAAEETWQVEVAGERRSFVTPGPRS